MSSLRPLLGWDEIRRRAPEPEQDASAEARIWRLRVLVPAAAVTGDRIGLDGLVREARELAGRACAPILGWLADWAEALSDIAAGRDGRAANHLLAATSSIERFGERYKAARLLLDALPFMRETVAREIAPELVGRFSSMAANESAVSARAFIPT